MDSKLDEIIALLRLQVAAIQALAESNRDLIAFMADGGLDEDDPEPLAYLDGSPVNG